MTAIILAAIAAIPPRPAATIAAWLVGRPSIADGLRAISWRESRNTRVGVHPGDAGRSDEVHANAVRVGWLDPANCPAHAYRPGVWSTHGAWGLMAGYNLKWIGGCLPPEALDVPIVSALAAARKYVARCLPRSHDSWCPEMAA